MKLFGKAEKMPETLAELTALCPELVAQAQAEATATIDVEAIRKESADAATAFADEKHTAETERIYAIVGAACSEDIAAKIRQIVASGITGEQYKAIGSPLVSLDSAKEKELKTQILSELKKTGADNPGHEGQAQGKQFNADTDTKKENQDKIDKLLAEYKTANPEASYRDALIAVSDKNPELFRDR
jgi:hypothetical protein